MIKAKVFKNGAEVQFVVFPNQQVANSWIKTLAENKSWGLPERQELDEKGQPTGIILPAEYTVEIEDITAQVEAEKSKQEQRKANRAARIAALKATNLDGLDTIAKCRAVIKFLVQEVLKDED